MKFCIAFDVLYLISRAVAMIIGGPWS